MKNAIFITVRSGSKRLPNKALLEIDGKTTIEYLIERCKKSLHADGIVLCTTTLPEDNILEDIAKRSEINCFRGNAEDKLERWLGAVNEFNVEYFVTADGDDIFCDSELMDIAFKQFEETGSDFIEGKEIVFGGFSFAIKASALKKVCEIKGTNETEMMWVYFTDTGHFKTELLKNVPAVFKRPDIRATLDYQDDFKFFKNVIEYFHYSKKDDFSLRDIIQYLDEKPEVIQINRYLHTDWLENQKNKTKLILK